MFFMPSYALTSSPLLLELCITRNAGTVPQLAFPKGTHPAASSVAHATQWYYIPGSIDAVRCEAAGGQPT